MVDRSATTKAGFCSDAYSPSDDLPVDNGPADGSLEVVDGEALVALDGRQLLVLDDLVSDALPDGAHDTGEARRNLDHRFLVGAQHTVELQRVAQCRGPRFRQHHAAGGELDVGDVDAVGAMFVLFGAVVRRLLLPFRLLLRRSLGGRRAERSESDGGAGGDRHHDDDQLGRPVHLVLSRASANGLPTSPSIVATATWKFCCASCSRSRAWTTLACASRTSSSEKRP